MAYFINFEAMLRRCAHKLNPCRWCGERPSIERREIDWGYETQLRATCPENHDPVYLGGALYHTDVLDQAYSKLAAAAGMLADLWNERHDGPAFIVGLA